MLILLPNDRNLANVLLKHVKTQVQRSKNKSAALVLISSTENNEYLLSDFHYVGEEPLNLKYKDSPQIVRLWHLGNFLKYRPLFGGKETDSDDDAAVPSFSKLPPCFSLDELKRMNQYAKLKPAYDVLSSDGMNTRNLTHVSCFVSLHPEAPHPILFTTLKLSNERSLIILFDTCSSLDLIDEDVAKQCNFPLRKSEKIIFRVAGCHVPTGHV